MDRLFIKRLQEYLHKVSEPFLGHFKYLQYLLVTKLGLHKPGKHILHVFYQPVNDNNHKIGRVVRFNFFYEYLVFFTSGLIVPGSAAE
jgi:hypothetical protein